MIAANDYVDPMLPRMSPVQLRMLIAQASGLLAHATTPYETRTVLSRVMHALPSSEPPRGAIIASVSQRIAAEAGITVADLVSDTRRRPIVLLRWRAWYEIYERGLNSYPQIGKFFNRDHTTVIHGAKKWREMLAAGEVAK